MKKFLILCTILLLIAPPAYSLTMEDYSFGGHTRVRGYDMKNFWTFNDDQDFDNWSTFRHRTSLWTKVDTGYDVTGYVKITNQNYGEGLTYEDAWEVDNASNKLFIDNAYIDINNLFDVPVALRIGRQNVIYGTGFVLLDGQSQFASTSIYFDGLKLSADLGQNAKVDLLYLKDQEGNRDDGSDDDITLSGAYFTANCPIIGGQQELYILNREDENIEKDIWMGGIRLSDKFECGLDYSGEFAYQIGDAFEAEDGEDIDQEAYGYKLDLGYTLKDVAPTPRFFLGYAFLSGDEDDTDDESNRWDVFYGGWPQFGDQLAWKYVNIGPGNNIANYDEDYNELSSTGGEAVYSNLSKATAGVGLNFTKKLNAKISYSMLTVDEPDPGADDDFGDYYQLEAQYKYTDFLTFALYAAAIEPGDAFVNDDTAHELFWETKLTF